MNIVSFEFVEKLEGNSLIEVKSDQKKWEESKVEMIDAWFDGEEGLVVGMDNDWDDWEEFVEYCKGENKLVWIEVYREDYVEFLEFIDYCFKFDEESRFWESDEDENSKWFGLGCYVGYDFDEVYVS